MPGHHVEVNIDKLLVDQFAGWNGPIGRSIKRLAKLTVDIAKVEAPKKTLHLMGSIKYKKMSGPRGIAFEAGSTARHALWMERGTLPHTIKPKNPGGMLVFYWPKMGQTVHLRSVSHPGTKPYRYMEKGLSKAMKIWKVTG